MSWPTGTATPAARWPPRARSRRARAATRRPRRRAGLGALGVHRRSHHRVGPGPGEPPNDQRPDGVQPAPGGDRRRARRGAGRPGARSPESRHHQPRSGRGQAVLLPLRRPGRPVPRRPARAGPGLLREVPERLRLHPETDPGPDGGRPVPGRRRHRPRRAGVDLPRPGPGGERPVGRAEGAPRHRRRSRHGGRGGGEALPGRGAAPHHRADLQLRHPRRPGLHRHGVRGRPVPQDHAEAAAGRQRGPARPAAGRRGHRLRPRRPPGLRLPARPGPRVLRLQARQPLPGRPTR